MATTTKILRIPLVAVPQEFDIELSARLFRLSCVWNDESQVWELSISDATTGESLIACLPLVAGTDLLRQHRHLGIPGSLYVRTSNDLFADPTLTNLGSESDLFYVVET